MKNKIILIILGIVLISLISATNIFSGESTTITLPEQYEYYSIIGNSTPVNVSQNNLNVTITIDKYSQSDEFEIIFFNKEKEIINHYSSGGGSYKSEKEYIEVPNYIDRVVYENNKTGIDKLTNDLRKMEEKLKKAQMLDNFLIIVLVIIVIFFVLNTLRKQRMKNENGK